MNIPFFVHPGDGFTARLHINDTSSGPSVVLSIKVEGRHTEDSADLFLLNVRQARDLGLSIIQQAEAILYPSGPEQSRAGQELVTDIPLEIERSAP